MLNVFQMLKYQEERVLGIIYIVGIKDNLKDNFQN